MSVLATAIGVTAEFVAQVSDPDPQAPAGLQAKTDIVLGLVKWGSLIAVLGLLLASGMIALAGDRGYGGGMSPELKSAVMKGVIALVIVASASQIVTFVA
jgi:hypothetical protein